jgi:hypothetical protein
MFCTLKVERNQKFVWELPDGICRPDPKSQKNYRFMRSTYQNENLPKITMFSTLIVENSKKFVPDRICRLNPNSKKKYRNAKSTIQNESFPKKKLCLVSLKKKRSQKCIWGPPDGIFRIISKFIRS